MTHNVSNEGDFKTPPTSPPKKEQPTDVTRESVTSPTPTAANETFDDLADIIGRLNIDQTPSKPVAAEPSAIPTDQHRDSTGAKSDASSAFLSPKCDPDSDPEISFGRKSGATNASCDSTLELLPATSFSDTAAASVARDDDAPLTDDNFNANNSYTSSRRAAESTSLVTSPASSIDRQRELARFILAPQVPTGKEPLPPDVRHSPTFTRPNAAQQVLQSPPTRDQSPQLPPRRSVSPGSRSQRENTSV